MQPIEKQYSETTAATANVEAPVPALFSELSDPEVELLRDVVLGQLGAASGEEEVALLTAVWHQTERELRHRKSQVRELERMYFRD